MLSPRDSDVLVCLRLKPVTFPVLLSRGSASPRRALPSRCKLKGQWSWNVHAVRLACFKCASQWFRVCSPSWATITTTEFQNTFFHPVPISPHSPPPPPPSKSPAIPNLPVSMHLSSVNMSCKWDHNTMWLFVSAFFHLTEPSRDSPMW